MSEISLDFHLHPAQLEVFQSKARFVICAAGRRFGKSHLAAKRAICKALQPENEQRKPVWLIAPVQPQAKRIYWRLLKELAHPLIVDSHVNDGTIDLENGVQLGVKGADRPDTMRGDGLWDATLDEIAFMKPEVWETIVRPALADVLGTAFFIGTPSGRNHFFQLYQEAEHDPEWERFHFTSMDNPYLPAGEIEAARKNLSSSAFRQEFLASFETGGADLMKLEWLKYVDVEPKDGDYFVAVDLAGFANVAAATNLRMKRLDQTAIAIVKVMQDGQWWVRDLILGRWGVEETARRIVEAIDLVKPLAFGIEKGALYNAVEPYLRAGAARKNIPLRVEALSHENRSKADRITWALQGRAENGKLTLSCGPWNKELEDQWVHFPSKLVHDDMLDALAYVAQLVEGRVFENFGAEVSEPYWEPMDRAIGF